jgi:hypothetical protein
MFEIFYFLAKAIISLVQQTDNALCIHKSDVHNSIATMTSYKASDP